MYWTFADQHTLNLDKLVPYAIYSLLKRLKLSSVLSFCPAWITATAYSLAVHSFSLTNCRKFRTQLHDLSVVQKKKTWPCPTHSSVVTLASNQGTNTVQNLHALLQCNHWHWTTIPLRTSPSFTLPPEISVPPQTHAFSRFLVLIPKHLVRDHSHMSVPLPYTLRHSYSQTSFRQALKTHLFQQSF